MRLPPILDPIFFIENAFDNYVKSSHFFNYEFTLFLINIKHPSQGVSLIKLITSKAL